MNWYCIHTKPQSERYAAEQLAKNLALEVYAPRMRREKIIRRVRREVMEPLFPRYLFCRFDLNTDYRAVRYTHDVREILTVGEHPAVVQDTFLADLKTWCDEASRMPVRSLFSSGDRVEIIRGPMQGLEAIIMQKRSGSDRVAVLLSILGCDAQLTIRTCDLAKAS
jgi:transcriptional antiterminator RfaH